jgi:hypothetical protein
MAFFPLSLRKRKEARLKSDRESAAIPSILKNSPKSPLAQISVSATKEKKPGYRTHPCACRMAGLSIQLPISGLAASDFLLITMVR